MVTKAEKLAFVLPSMLASTEKDFSDCLRHVAKLADIKIDYTADNATVTPKTVFADICNIANKMKLRYSKDQFRSLLQSLNVLKLNTKTGEGNVNPARDIESLIMASLYLTDESINKNSVKLSKYA